MAESTEEGKEDTISQDEIDGLLAPSAKAPESDDLEDLFFKDEAETATVFAEIDSLRTQVAELQAGRDVAYDASAKASREMAQLRQSGNALQEKLETAHSELSAVRNELGETKRNLAKALDEKALANRVADERGVRIKELQATLATERKYAADEQAELVKDTDAELKRERSRFHWREAIASAICTATFIVGMYGIAVAVDIITTSDEETPAAIEETRRDREPAAQTPSTTQPAAKAPIKKRFGTGAK